MIHDAASQATPSLSARELLKERLRRHQVSARPSATPIEPRRGAATRLSFAQQRLWLLDQIMGAHHAYNMSLAIDIAGALDAVALRASAANGGGRARN